jgi:hypothetical protein
VTAYVSVTAGEKDRILSSSQRVLVLSIAGDTSQQRTSRIAHAHRRVHGRECSAVALCHSIISVISQKAGVGPIMSGEAKRSLATLCLAREWHVAQNHYVQKGMTFPTLKRANESYQGIRGLKHTYSEPVSAHRGVALSVYS